MSYPLLTAFGLALATGADATIPIFLFALLARLGVVPLAAPWEGLITSPVALGAFGAIAILDFVSSRSDNPTIAELGHRVRQFITIGAGGVLAMTQSRTGLIDSATYAITGAGVAAAASHTRAGFRRADPRLTPRVRIWAQRLGDGFAVATTLIALRHPHLLVAFLLWAAVVFAVLIVVLVTATRRRLRDLMPAFVAMSDAFRGRAPSHRSGELLPPTVASPVQATPASGRFPWAIPSDSAGIAPRPVNMGPPPAAPTPPPRWPPPGLPPRMTAPTMPGTPVAPTSVQTPWNAPQAASGGVPSSRPPATAWAPRPGGPYAR